MLKIAQNAAWIAAFAFVVAFFVGMVMQASEHPPKQQGPQTEQTLSSLKDEPQSQGKSHWWSSYQEQVKGYWNSFVDLAERRDKAFVAISTIFIALFTIVLAFATLFLLFSTRNLVADAKQTANRQLRAYVYMNVSARIYPTPPENFSIIALGVQFSLTIKNSGQTWAPRDV